MTDQTTTWPLMLPVSKPLYVAYVCGEDLENVGDATLARWSTEALQRALEGLEAEGEDALEFVEAVHGLWFTSAECSPVPVTRHGLWDTDVHVTGDSPEEALKRAREWRRGKAERIQRHLAGWRAAA